MEAKRQVEAKPRAVKYMCTVVLFSHFVKMTSCTFDTNMKSCPLHTRALVITPKPKVVLSLRHAMGTMNLPCVGSVDCPPEIAPGHTLEKYVPGELATICKRSPLENVCTA